MKERFYFFVLGVIIILNMNSFALAQESGSIWVKTYEPGSANPKDETIDSKALAFVDSLMMRDDIEVMFLGGADQLKWKSLPNKTQISSAFDQAKKMERASKLRERYGRGEIGITDEPIRGVKVVWSPKKPDPFKMKNEIQTLKAQNDSLLQMFASLKGDLNDQLVQVKDDVKTVGESSKTYEVDREIVTSFFDWEIKTGLLTWTAGKSYDLTVPSIGIALKREYWTFEFEGGFTPWSKPDKLGNRGDALLIGTITMLPQKNFEIKTGMFSGWEFFSNTDEWTMKVMGLTSGPSFKWKFIEGFAGYSYARISTLLNGDEWKHGILVNTNFKFLLN